MRILPLPTAAIPSFLVTMLFGIVGCAPYTAPAPSATLLNRADPAAAALLGYLQLQHIPTISINGSETRIQATDGCRDALIRFMEISRLRMETCAANIANANTTRDADGKPNPYLRRFVIATSSGAIQTRMDDCQFPTRYCPGHPDADAAGWVKYPNVDLAAEYADCQEACRNYELAESVLRRLDPSIVVCAIQSPTPPRK